MIFSGMRVAVGNDPLLHDWLERLPDAELRAAHWKALSTLTEARLRRLQALDRHQREQGEVLAGDDKLGADIAAERREVDEETGRAMIAMAELVDRVIATVGEAEMRDKLLPAQRNASWLRRESQPLLKAARA